MLKVKTVVFSLLILGALAGAAYYAYDRPADSPPSFSASGKKITDLSGQERIFSTPSQKIILVRSRDIYGLSAVAGSDTAAKITAWGPDIMSSDKDAYEKYAGRFPDLKSKPVTGDIFKDAINPESILAFGPDLVVLDNFMVRRKYKSVDRMEAAGLPLVFMDQSNELLSNPQKGIEIWGKLLDQEDRAKEINDYVNGKIDAVKERLAKINKPMPVVYVEAGSNGVSKYGSSYGRDQEGRYTAWGAMVEYARGRNMIDGKIGDMTTIEPEFLLKSDPDIIIITGANWSGADTMRLGYYADQEQAEKLLAGFVARHGWQDLKAVKNKKVYSTFHGFVMHIFNFVAFEQLAKWFYPEEFADLDPESDFREFHQKFLPIEYSGVWEAELK